MDVDQGMCGGPSLVVGRGVAHELRRMSDGLGRRNGGCREGKGIYGGNELHTERCLLDKERHSKAF